MSSSDLSTSEEEDTGTSATSEDGRSGRSVSDTSRTPVLADFFCVLGLRYDEAPVALSSGGGGGGKSSSAKGKAKVVPGVPYRGRTLSRFPSVAPSKDRDLPSHLWLFVFPSGCVLEAGAQAPPPRFFVNALTYSDGTRSYVVAIKFFERTGWSTHEEGPSSLGSLAKQLGASVRRSTTSGNLPQSQQQQQPHASQQSQTLWAPKALCYVTQLPLFAFFKNYMSELLLFTAPSSTSSTVPLEQYIAQLIAPVPVVFTSGLFDQFRVTFSVGKSQIPCVLPNVVEDFCLTDVSFRFLFNALPVSTVITVLAALLTEQKIVFHSRHYMLLVTVMQSAIDLLLPFTWCHTLIPAVPSNLLEFVDAPTPYVMGLHASQLSAVGPLDDVIVVDCDRSGGLRVPSFFVPLPKDLEEWMTAKLNATLSKFGVSKKSNDFIEAEMEKIDLVFATRSAGYDGASTDAELTLELRLCFMALYGRMFFGYDRYVNRHGNTGSRMTLFDEPGFTATRQERHRPFVSEVVSRSIFDMFIESPEPKLFALFSKLALEFSEAEVLANLEKMRRGASTRTVDVPPPPGGVGLICSYNLWPATLDEARFSTATGKQQSAQPSLSPRQEDVPRLYSDVSRKVRDRLLPDGSSQERLVMVETLHRLIMGLHSGTTDALLAGRAEAWFRGARIETTPEPYEARDATVQHKKGKTLRVKVKEMAKKLHKNVTPKMSRRTLSASVVPARAVSAPVDVASGGSSGGWTNPDQWQGGEASGDPGGGGAGAGEPSGGAPLGSEACRSESARESMLAFVQILRFYCEAGEVRFASRKCFRDLCRLLRSIVGNCDAGLRQEQGVVVCWSCSEMNPSGYAVCAACNEPPLTVEDEEAGGDAAKEADAALVFEPRSAVERSLFDVLRLTVGVGSVTFHAPNEGFALGALASDDWPVLHRPEFWTFCLFADYCDKTKVTSIVDPRAIPPYPDLFPLCAFYVNALALLKIKEAPQFLERLPVDSHIQETLAQLYAMFGQAGGSSASSSERRGGKFSNGVRVMDRAGLLDSRKAVAQQMEKAAVDE